MAGPRREGGIQRVRARLLRHGLPRLQMTIIVFATGLAGFGVSTGLLKSGVDSMALRYTLAVVLSYLVFLALVRLWIAWQRRQLELDVDIPDATLPDAGPRGGDAPDFGGGGRFGGGGAGGSFEVTPGVAPTGPGPAAMPSAPASRASWDSGPTESGGSSPSLPDGLSVDLDDGWIVVVPLALGAASLLALVWVVWAAPTLFAELLLDVLIVARLYRRLRREEAQHWLSVAFRRTWLPALGVMLLLGIAGYAMQAAVPEARSIGEFFDAI